MPGPHDLISYETSKSFGVDVLVSSLICINTWRWCTFSLSSYHAIIRHGDFFADKNFSCSGFPFSLTLGFIHIQWGAVQTSCHYMMKRIAMVYQDTKLPAFYRMPVSQSLYRMPRHSTECLSSQSFYRMPRLSIEFLDGWSFYRMPRQSIECQAI